MPTYFTVVADYRAFVEDAASDSDYNPQNVPVGATVTFTPLVNSGDVVRSLSASPRPVGYVPAPVSAVIDPVDGRLKLRDVPDSDGSGDFAPVRLLGSSPDLELDGPLFYRVSFSGVTFSGNRVGSITGFVFEAPSSDVEVNLIAVGLAAGQTATNLVRPTVSAGTTSTGEPGSDAVVAQRGTETARIFDFTIPRGDVGPEGPTGPAGTTSWDGVSGKPAVIAAGASQAEARAAIGAGTSSLEIGTSDSTAKRGDYTPTSSEITAALGFTPESAANRNAASGYAGLDSSGLIPSSLLPGFVDDVIEGADLAAFPATGVAGKLYVALDSGTVYRWSGSTYVEVSASPGSTDAVPEGSVNQYFTAARAQNALTTQLSGKSDVGHTHSQSDITNLATTLAGKSDVGHGHIESDITGLTAALGGKEPTITASTTDTYWRGDKSWRGFDAGVADSVSAASNKSTPVDADVVPLVDSAASNVLKKWSWANIKAALKAYFDDLTTTFSNKTLSAPVLTGTTQVSTGGTVELYNVGSSGATNFERLSLQYSSNTAQLGTFFSGTGTATRNLQIGVAATAGSSSLARSIQISNTGPYVQFPGGNASATAIVGILNAWSGSSGTQVGLQISPTLNQSSTASYTALLINPTETATGSGTKRLIDAQVGGASKFTVDNAGLVNAVGGVQVNGVDVVTTTGTQSLSNKVLADPSLTGTAKGATGASLELYNTADQTTNYERGRLYWNSNILTLSTDGGGTGSTNRSITLTAGGSTVTLSNTASSRISIGAGNASTTTAMVVLPTTFLSSSLTQSLLSVSPTINQSGTAGYTCLLINPTETAVGSGTKRLIDAQVGGVSLFTVDNAGNVAASGTFKSNGVEVATVSGTQTLTNKRWASATVPATATSTGTVGQIAYDSNYVYICTATDTWRRAALASW